MLTLMEGRDRMTIVIWAVCALLVVALGVRWLSSAGLTGLASSGSRSYSSRSSGGSGGSASTGAEAVAGRTAGVGSSAVVDVAGRVRHPGVYRLAAGARVYEAIARAGGLLPDANAALINRAARVADGSQIMVGRRGQAPAAGVGATGGAGPVSLSTATVEQLDGLDGIGPALAQRIVDWRVAHGGFRNIDELDEVSGIGPAKLAALRSQVVP